MKWTGILCASLLFGSSVGCGAAPMEADDENLGEVSQAFSPTAHDPFWWGDIVDDVSNVTMEADSLDQFQIHAGDILHWRLKFGAWSDGAAMTRPAGITFKAVAASASSEFIDLFALGSNNRIYHRFVQQASNGNLGAWSSWAQVAGAGAVKPQSKLAVTAWAEGRMDLFWITSSNVIGHAWYDNGFVLGGVQTGSNTAWLQNLPGVPNGNIEAVSWGPGRIDLFLHDEGDKWSIHHHFWDNGNFGRAEYLAKATDEMTVDSLAVTSAGPNQITLFGRRFPAPPPGQPSDWDVPYVTLSGLQANRSTLQFSRPFGILPAVTPVAPFVIHDVVRRIENGVVKNELWGAGDVSNAPLYSVWFGD